MLVVWKGFLKKGTFDDLSLIVIGNYLKIMKIIELQESIKNSKIIQK